MVGITQVSTKQKATKCIGDGVGRKRNLNTRSLQYLLRMRRMEGMEITWSHFIKNASRRRSRIEDFSPTMSMYVF